jgi:hypothetical protein
MNFKRIYKKNDEMSVIYIRFRYSNLNKCNYVGQTINILNGRPFRPNAYGGLTRGSGKWKSIITLRCPDSRLDTREAYFVLKYKPCDMNLCRYFKKAWHLLKKKELVEVLRIMFVPERWSEYDWQHINGSICEIENEENYEPLVHKFIGNHL